MKTIQEFIDALNAKFTSLGYTRVIHRFKGGRRSAYCFIDAAGNVYKTAGWKAPAKGVRSTLATVNMSTVDACTSWLKHPVAKQPVLVPTQTTMTLR